MSACSNVRLRLLVVREAVERAGRRPGQQQLDGGDELDAPAQHPRLRLLAVGLAQRSHEQLRRRPRVDLVAALEVRRARQQGCSSAGPARGPRAPVHSAAPHGQLVEQPLVFAPRKAHRPVQRAALAEHIHRSLPSISCIRAQQAEELRQIVDVVIAIGIARGEVGDVGMLHAATRSRTDGPGLALVRLLAQHHRRGPDAGGELVGGLPRGSLSVLAPVHDQHEPLGADEQLAIGQRVAEQPPHLVRRHVRREPHRDDQPQRLAHRLGESCHWPSSREVLSVS